MTVTHGVTKTSATVTHERDSDSPGSGRGHHGLNNQGLPMTPNSSCNHKTNIATAAKCDKSCDGVCHSAEIGCIRGLPEWQRHVERRLQSSSGQKQQNNGLQATEARQVTGDEHHRSRETFDQVALRWVLAGLAIGWLSAAIVGLKGCTV
jgi:hypothetical protein